KRVFLVILFTSFSGSLVSRISGAVQEQFGLKTSMSRKGNCYDNAPMESFWGTLKNESLSHYRFNNRDEAISVIREYIEIFYNRQRRHSRLGNISPAAFREKYHQITA
ncbi:integrase core domain-containing protein, partial [Escherichia coli]|uniref:integrase core domain-containing protein n=2 Tax=Escherichia coli TaxID=562 RepID=UPI003290A7CB